MKLSYLTDQILHQELITLTKKERFLTKEIILHIQEVWRRKLFSAMGYSSLFNYLTKGLGYSEGAAQRRISASKISLKYPEILEKIENSKLSMGQLVFVNSIADPKFQKDVLKVIEGKSQKETQKIIQDITNSKQMGQTYKVFLCEKTKLLLEEYKTLKKSHLKPEELIFSALETAIKVQKEKKYKLNSKSKISSTRTRYISNGLKKLVYERDQGKCLQCGSARYLEYDHCMPFSLGGKTELKNLRLLCRYCNQRKAIEAKIYRHSEEALS